MTSPDVRINTDNIDIPASHRVILDGLDFEIGKRLGRGGFGVVHAGQFGPTSHLLRGVKFAVKVQVVVGKADPMMEARTMVNLNHRHCLRMYHVLHFDTTPWLQNNISYYLNRNEPLPENRLYIFLELADYDVISVLNRFLRREIDMVTLKTWFGQLAAALDYLHSHDLVHRDIHEGNVLFFNNAATHKIDAKLTDFGHTVDKQRMTATRFELLKYDDIEHLADFYEYLFERSEDNQDQEIVWIINHMKELYVLASSRRKRMSLQDIAQRFGYQD